MRTTKKKWHTWLLVWRSAALVTPAFRTWRGLLGLIPVFLLRSCRRPRDWPWGCGSDVMEQPLGREHLRRMQYPPRLHTALHEGSKQHASQHWAPPRSTASGRQPSPITLLQEIPNTPPVTLHRLASTPENKRENYCVILIYKTAKWDLNNTLGW